MIVQLNRRSDVWHVFDRGRQFSILPDVATAAYRDHLRRLSEACNRQMFAFVTSPDDALTIPPTRLPTLVEFLEQFALEEWDRKGLLPADHAHHCKYEEPYNECPPCVCECGAILVHSPTFSEDGLWVWKLRNGTHAPFPDPKWLERNA